MTPGCHVSHAGGCILRNRYRAHLNAAPACAEYCSMCAAWGRPVRFARLSLVCRSNARAWPESFSGQTTDRRRESRGIVAWRQSKFVLSPELGRNRLARGSRQAHAPSYAMPPRRGYCKLCTRPPSSIRSPGKAGSGSITGMASGTKSLPKAATLCHFSAVHGARRTGVSIIVPITCDRFDRFRGRVAQKPRTATTKMGANGSKWPTMESCWYREILVAERRHHSHEPRWFNGRSHR